MFVKLYVLAILLSKKIGLTGDAHLGYLLELFMKHIYKKSSPCRN